MLKVVVNNDFLFNSESANNGERRGALHVVRKDGLQEKLQAYIDMEMHQLFVEQEVPELFALVRYHMGIGESAPGAVLAPKGKKILPLLCLLANEALGGDSKQVIPAACALELLYQFALLQNRLAEMHFAGKVRTYSGQLGGFSSMFHTGLALQGLIGRSLSRLQDMDLPPDKTAEVSNIIQETILLLSQGQFLSNQANWRHKGPFSKESFDMIRLKTGSMTSCAAWIGSYLANGDRATAGKFYGVGMHLGIALHLQGMKNNAGNLRKAIEDNINFYRDKALSFLGEGEEQAQVDYGLLRRLVDSCFA